MYLKTKSQLLSYVVTNFIIGILPDKFEAMLALGIVAS